MKRLLPLLCVASLLGGCLGNGLPGLPLPGGWEIGGLHPPEVEQTTIAPPADDPFRGLRRMLTWIGAGCVLLIIGGLVLRTYTPVGTDLALAGVLGFGTSMVLFKALQYWWVILIAWLIYWAWEMWSRHRMSQAEKLAINTVDLVKREDWETRGKELAKAMQPRWFRKRVRRIKGSGSAE